MPLKSADKKSWLAAALAGGVALGLVAWIGYTIFGGPGRAEHAKVTRDRLDPKHPAPADLPLGELPWRRVSEPAAADLPVGLLFDCYEHGIENAPPRGDTSRRQWNWQAPPLPLQLGRTAVEAADPQLFRWLQVWDAGWRNEALASPQRLVELSRVLARTPLPFETLFRLGLALNYLDGDAPAAYFYRAALAAAEREYKGLPPGDPAARPLLEAMPQMAALWRLQDQPALERRFGLEKRLYPPLSPEARRAAHLHAEARYYQGSIHEAASALAELQAAHERVGDLSESDWYEMHWVQGLFLHQIHRYAEALPHLRSAMQAKEEQHYTKSGWAILIQAAARCGHVAEAKSALDTWRTTYSVSSYEERNLAAEVDDSTSAVE